MSKEVSHRPVFYFATRPDLVLPSVWVSPERKIWVEQMKTKRYVYRGYPPVIEDNLLGHTMRVVTWSLTLPHLSGQDISHISNIMMVHDAGEIGLDADVTTVDKSLNPQEAQDLLLKEEATARMWLSEEDFKLWQQYETAKPLLAGDVSPKDVEVIPNAIVAKALDIAENETYFHSQFRSLLAIYGSAIYDFFPAESFKVTFPRLRKYRPNLTKLNLPDAHLMVINELFAEVEAYARVAGQIEG